MLQRNSKAIVARALALVLFSVTLLSFSGNFGSDSYQIYVNNKLVLKDYVHNQNGVKSFQLDPARNDQVDVYYSHCGQIGKSRSITIKNEQNKTLHEWHFAEAAGKNTGMSFKVNDIAGIQKMSSNSLRLIYSSKEIPDGRLLATIVLGNDATAKRK